MKAIVYTKYGGPEVLQLQEVEKPVPGNGELLVKVHAVSINDWDWGKLDGSSLFNRLLSGLFKPRHQVLGSDIAGEVESVGENVKRFKIGHRVYGDLSGQWGGFAEYVCAKENQLEFMPGEMSYEQAAAIPQAAMLAIQGLVDKGHIQPGQKLLINGAGGGVGTFGLQLALMHGVEVTVVDSADKLEMLRSMGAAHLVDFTKEDFTKSSYRYDMILDVKTTRPILQYLRVLNPGGIYITVGGSLPRLFQALLLIPWIKLFSRKRIGIVTLKTNKDLAYMNELFLSGKVRPVMDRFFQLEEVPEAFRFFGSAAHKGKIVIRVRDDNDESV